MSALSTRSSEPYWNKVAETYDQVFPHTLVGRAQRDIVWHELDRVFQPGRRILELNCGTGIDAVHLAESGVTVLACDISSRMIEIAWQRLRSTGLEGLVEFRALPTEDIAVLEGKGCFDGAFSNFSGLNHVRDLSSVARNLARLLKPGARAVLCMAARFVPSEMAWYLAQGNLRKAMRRLTQISDDGRLKVHYPSVGAMARIFAPEFRLREWKGIGVMVPSCIEHVVRRHPRILDGLARADRWLSCVPGLRGMGDCVLLQFERIDR
jgi:2-polyprenyl-3-methyl-5-hydroxy-6-metoxy-1,4-benzoquinol methylase